MNKNIYIILLLMLLVVFGGFYYAYFQLNNSEKPQQQNQASQSEEVPDLPDEPTPPGQCAVAKNKIVDGDFVEIKEGFLYLKNEDGLEKVEITEETSFARMNISLNNEIDIQESISQSDLAEGDQISIVALCKECADNDKDCEELTKALIVRQVNVEKEN